MKAGSAKWTDAGDEDIAPLSLYTCAHYFRIAGCPKCMGKVFDDVENYISENGECAFITKPMTEEEASLKEKEFEANGISVLSRIRVL